MSVNLTIAGQVFVFPTEGEDNWGQNVTAWATAVSTYLLQRTGGSFTLSNDVDFGASFATIQAYLKSRTANISSAGFVRMAKTDTIAWRNNANNGNLLLSVDASDNLLFNGNTLLTTIGALLASRALVSSAGGDITVSATTAAEIAFVSGVTSAIQTQLNAKQATLTLPLSNANGGTGTATYTKGDFLYASASNTLSKLPIGTDLQYLNVATDVPAWKTLAPVRTGPREVINVALAGSVAASALTIALKTQAGSDASAGSPILIDFRNPTLTTGTYNERSVTGALSTMISSGSTAGFQFSPNPQPIWVYAIDNAGTVELAWSASKIWDENLLYNTTAEGGAGAADNSFTLYSTTARTAVPIRLLGSINSIVSTPGTWAAAPAEISCVNPGPLSQRSEVLVYSGNGYGSTATKIRRFSTATINIGTAIGYTQSATAGDSFIIYEAGLYFMSASDFQAGGSIYFGISRDSASLTTAIDSINPPENCAMTLNQAGAYGMCSDTKRLQVGDVIRHHAGGAGGDAGNPATTFHIIKICD